jgi:hypothetical protein
MNGQKRRSPAFPKTEIREVKKPLIETRIIEVPIDYESNSVELFAPIRKRTVIRLIKPKLTSVIKTTQPPPEAQPIPEDAPLTAAQEAELKQLMRDLVFVLSKEASEFQLQYGFLPTESEYLLHKSAEAASGTVITSPIDGRVFVPPTSACNISSLNNLLKQGTRIYGGPMNMVKEKQADNPADNIVKDAAVNENEAKIRNIILDDNAVGTGSVSTSTAAVGVLTNSIVNKVCHASCLSLSPELDVLNLGCTRSKGDPLISGSPPSLITSNWDPEETLVTFNAFQTQQ